MTSRRWLVLAGLALAVTLIAGRVLATAYADWLWYQSLGAGALWSVRMASLTALRLGLFVVAFSFAFGNLLAMRRSIVSLVLPRRVANLEIGEAVPPVALTIAAALLSVLIAAAVALPQGDWLSLVRAQWATPIGESDPYLNRDIAFWIAWLPLERDLQAWAVMLAVIVGTTVMTLYAMTPSVQVQRGQLHISTWVRRHFAVYSAVLLVLVAWGYRLDAFDLLIHGSGVRETFSAFDHRVMFPYLIALCFGTAGVAVLVVWTGWVGHQRATLGALLLALLVGPLGRVALPLLDRQSATERERASLERPYTQVRALYTRRAFGVDDIARGPDADSVRVPFDSVASRVSSWDPPALAVAAANAPAAAMLPGAFAWRAASGGALRVSVAFADAASEQRGPVLLEEVDPTDADERGAPWPSEHATGGALPPIAVGTGLPAVQLAADTLGRLAAPLFASGWRRLALAWSERNFRLAFDEADPRRTRLLTRRDVRERVLSLLPFFAAGPTVQAIVVRDSLWWTVELFNASGDYPLTEAVGLHGTAVRFASPAGVAVVNAHSGRVQVALPARPDKVTRWWRDKLPALFITRQAFAPDLSAALPPPVDRASMQGQALSRTGFRNDTLAARPLLDDNADADLHTGSPTLFVSGASGHPLAWSVATVDGVDRLRGALVAVGGRNARTVLVDAPDTLSFARVLDALQHAADSGHISRTRRQPRRGAVQVIPTTAGLLAVQSHYEWVPDRAPTLSGVAMYLRAGARTGATVATAFGLDRHVAAGDATLRLKIARVYQQLQDARRRGDWNAFGQAIDALGRLIARTP